ncbi:MAG: isocitrate lyase/phosphoenolpyruvate mutase family protein [Acidimicrobiia bacterium]|nr:isocitrate lyase/phosphoenolpyruvate mutase family protein [Acidimicrobiia bacterium]
MREARSRFRTLHEEGIFVMPNAWDSASAKVMAAVGAAAVATTSSGFAATLGRTDYRVTEEELIRHSALMTATAGVPVNVDSERCYGVDPSEVADFVHALAATGAAGCSIEDFNPATESIDAIDASVDRVAAASEAARAHGMVLTARAERHLYQADADFDDTMTRLRRFAEAGADCVYAPGLSEPAQIAEVCAIGPPVNVLISPATPTVTELAELGVRRVSTGGALVRSALGEVKRAVDELLTDGTLTYMHRALDGAEFNQLFSSWPRPV